MPIRSELHIISRQEEISIPVSKDEVLWLESILKQNTPVNDNTMSFKDLREDYNNNKLHDFTLFWYGQVMESLKEIGLLVL